jgi:hypothetical protein
MMNGNRFSFEMTTGTVLIIRNWGEAEGLTFFGFYGGVLGVTARVRDRFAVGGRRNFLFS